MHSLVSCHTYTRYTKNVTILWSDANSHWKIPRRKGNHRTHSALSQAPFSKRRQVPTSSPNTDSSGPNHCHWYRYRHKRRAVRQIVLSFRVHFVDVERNFRFYDDETAAGWNSFEGARAWKSQWIKCATAWMTPSKWILMGILNYSCFLFLMFSSGSFVPAEECKVQSTMAIQQYGHQTMQRLENSNRFNRRRTRSRCYSRSILWVTFFSLNKFHFFGNCFWIRQFERQTFWWQFGVLWNWKWLVAGENEEEKSHIENTIWCFFPKFEGFI